MASPSIVQSASGFVAGGTSKTVGFTANVTPGSLIVVFIGTTQGRTINTPTMTGETFTLVSGATQIGGGAGSPQNACYICSPATGGQKNVTATISGSNDDIHLHIVEVSGQAAIPIDASGVIRSNTVSVSTSLPTNNATDLVLAFFYDTLENPLFTPGSGYAQVTQVGDGGWPAQSLTESQTVSSTGTQTATATIANTRSVGMGIIAIASPSSAALLAALDFTPGAGGTAVPQGNTVSY